LRGEVKVTVKMEEEKKTGGTNGEGAMDMNLKRSGRGLGVGSSEVVAVTRSLTQVALDAKKNITWCICILQLA
jgi:hypothetical protein